MLEIRFHGRGGQGAVTSAEIIALAAIEKGRFAQSMPSFGPERRGAPVLAYLRVSDKKIRIRAEITKPDIVVVLDDSLMQVVDVTSGLKGNGLLVVNTKEDEDAIRIQTGFGGKIATADALGIALEILGLPITNTAMIGALIKASSVVGIDDAVAQLSHRFNPKLAEKNTRAMKKTYEITAIYEPKAVAAKPKRPQANLAKWNDILEGAIVDTPGKSKDYHTGDWRSQIPEYYKDKCSKCGLCYVFCPDAAITVEADGFVKFNYDYCKGCGICAKECPKDAIAMKPLAKK